jgi:hypothetical protein
MKKEKMGADQLAALGLTLVVASLTVGLLALGCGKQESETATTETGTIQTADAGKAPAVANAATSATEAKGNTQQSEQTDSIIALPPDVLATSSTEYVTPGRCEITAQGTPMSSR